MNTGGFSMERSCDTDFQFVKILFSRVLAISQGEFGLKAKMGR